MSIATLDLPRPIQIPVTAPSQDGPAGSNNVFLAALRRWPLLVLGVVVGMGAGFLIYSVQSPKYQSSAQIAIYKKNVRDNGNARMGIFEDYISAQIDTIRSQTILASASKPEDGSLNHLSTPLPDDKIRAADFLKGGLGVTRSKEGTGGMGISPVVNLTYTGRDPQDTDAILRAIIDTYVKELNASYSEETSRRLRGLNDQIKSIADQKALNDNRIAVLKRERNTITAERDEAISGRLSVTIGTIQLKEVLVTELEGQLESIKTVGPNRSERLELLARLRGDNRRAEQSLQSPEIQMQIAEAKMTQKLQSGMGRDHPDMKSMKAEYDFYKVMHEKQNPNAEADELSNYRNFLIGKLSETKRQLEKLLNNVATDTQMVQKSADRTTEIQSKEAENESINRKMIELNGERVNITSNEQIGGFSAKKLVEPQTGVKVAPVAMQWLMLGGVLGLLAGFGLSLAVELADKSFRTPAEIRQRLGVPVIGHIPAIRLELPAEADVPPEYSNSLVAARRPKSIESESYRGVRTQLSVITQNEGHQVIQVTSPNPGDGKSTLAANLAISIAQSGKRCILLDCDFRKPRVHKLFAISKPELGLASVTGGLAKLDQAIRHSSIDNLDILPCGPRPANPAELLSGERFQQVLADLRQMYDYVIVDTPPMLAVSDPRVVAQRVDGILLVFRITKKARPLAERAREQLADMGANLLGVIVNSNGVKRGDEYGYGYGYNYQYSYEYEYAETYVDTDADLDPNGSGKIKL